MTDRHDVVVYVAHPDDESDYVGGTIAALTARGRSVAVVSMSHGEGGRPLERGPDDAVTARRATAPADVAAVRDDEMRAAAAALGVEIAYLHQAIDGADFGRTSSLEDTLARWERDLPGGLEGILGRI